jgi:hypothetical protein
MMRLSELHLLKYARVDSSTKSMFTDAEGWAIEVRADLHGIVLGRKNRDDPKKLDQLWIPFTNCLNGVPFEVPKAPAK